MFYNSKKLIDEKVLQQYFFEKLMLSDGASLKLLIPPKFRNDFSAQAKIKGLRPEVTLSQINGKKYITDFVMYHTDPAVRPLNIEIKWLKSDFESWRLPYYDGTQGNGFLVCLDDESGQAFYKDTDIPIVYLDTEDFQKWFSVNANTIIAQTVSKKLGLPPARQTGRKYWLVAISNTASEHYLQQGKEKLIWAFRNNNKSANIMKILEGDYVVFVKIVNLHPQRAVYPYYRDENLQIEKSRGGITRSKNITWELEFADIFCVNNGYHLNFGDKGNYGVFESAQWDKSPETKDYTQFITFAKNDGTDAFCMHWKRSESATLPRRFFPAENDPLCRFVEAMRFSLNTKGDALEIGYESFQSFLQLLHD